MLFFFIYFNYSIQQRFICRPSDSTVLVDAGFEEGQIEGWEEGGRFRGMGSRRVGRGRRGRWVVGVRG